MDEEAETEGSCTLPKITAHMWQGGVRTKGLYQWQLHLPSCLLDYMFPGFLGVFLNRETCFMLNCASF